MQSTMKKKVFCALMIVAVVILLYLGRLWICGRTDAKGKHSRVKRSLDHVKAVGTRLKGMGDNLKIWYYKAKKDYEDVVKRKKGIKVDFNDAVDALIPRVIEAGINGACSKLCRSAGAFIKVSPVGFLTSTVVEEACKPLCFFVVKWLEDELKPNGFFYNLLC